MQLGKDIVMIAVGVPRHSPHPNTLPLAVASLLAKVIDLLPDAQQQALLVAVRIDLEG